MVSLAQSSEEMQEGEEGWLLTKLLSAAWVSCCSAAFRRFASVQLLAGFCVWLAHRDATGDFVWILRRGRACGVGWAGRQAGEGIYSPGLSEFVRTVLISGAPSAMMGRSLRWTMLCDV